MTDNNNGQEVSRTGAGLDLDGIEARCDKATPAPWVNFDPNAVLGVDAPEGGVVAWTYHRGNTNFIAHARTDVPALVAAVEAVLELHALGIGDLFTAEGIEARLEHCVECTQVEHRFVVRYPCPTVAAIRTALGESE